MIFILICLLCGFMIIRDKGQKRFDWFVCSALLLSSSITILKSPVNVFFSALTPARKNITFAASTLKQKSYLRSVSAVQ